MTKTILSSAIGLGISLSLVACGGGGGGGGAGGGSIDAQKAFKEDMAALNTTKISSEKVANAEITDSYTKVFGSASPAAVKTFIQERVKHVYAYDEVENFRVEISRNNTVVDTMAIGDLSGRLGKNYGDTRGVNYSSIAGNHILNPQFQVIVQTPNGPVNADSYRMGLVGLTPGYYGTINVQNVNTKEVEKLPVPFEDRIGILIHEGRHSDCHDTTQIGNSNPTICGYGHAVCVSGRYKGSEACESVPWGAYGIQLIYMLSVQDNYAAGTMNYRFIEQTIDDLRSRFAQNPQALEAMKNSNPLLD